MKYISLATWVDMTDGHEYAEGSPFPFDGREIPEERINALTTEENGIGRPVVAAVDEPEEPKKKN